MGRPFVLPHETSASNRARLEWTLVLCIDMVSGGNVTLEIVICPKRSFVLAIIYCTDKRVDMDIVDMCIEKVSALVGRLRPAFVPGTSSIGTPIAANLLGVKLDVDFMFLDTVEFTKGRALRPIAPKVSHREITAIIYINPRSRRAIVDARGLVNRVPIAESKLRPKSHAPVIGKGTGETILAWLRIMCFPVSHKVRLLVGE